MTTKERLIQELEHAPEELLKAVLNFVLTTKGTSNGTEDSDAATIPQQNNESTNGIQALLDLLDSMPLSPEDIASLPHDGAENHDHYLYGAPKKSA
jgi:hypothetical protein